MECFGRDEGFGWAYESQPDQWPESVRLMRPEWGTAYQKRVFQYCPAHRLVLLKADLKEDLSKNTKLIMWAYDWPTILYKVMFHVSDLGRLELMVGGQLLVDDALVCAANYSEPVMNDLDADLLVMARDMGLAVEDATRIHPYASVGDCLLELMRVDLLANPRTEARCGQHEKLVESWLERRLGPLNARARCQR